MQSEVMEGSFLNEKSEIFNKGECSMKRALFLLFVVVQSGIAQTTFHGIARTGVYESPGPKQLNGVKWTFKTDGPMLVVGNRRRRVHDVAGRKLPLREAILLSSAVVASPIAKDSAQGKTNAITAFVNVNVIPMDHERVLKNQTVVVRNGRVAEIGDAAKVKVPQGGGSVFPHG